MKKPLVSVIVPCYNYAAYVTEAIESVLAQTYKDIELIVVNDGSTDNSDAIIRKLLKKHNFIYHTQENKGIVATRNKGIELARGEYVIQLDADDWLESTYVAETVRCAQKNKADIVYTQAAIFGKVTFNTEYPAFNLEYLKHNNYIHASALLHRKVFNNRKYDEYLRDKWYEDWDLFLDACLDGSTAHLVDKPLLHYRKHHDVVSRSDDLDNTFKELLVRHHILNKQNAKHPEQMWYFSPYINILKASIDKYDLALKANSRAIELQKQVDRYHRMAIIKIGHRVKSLLRRWL